MFYIPSSCELMETVRIASAESSSHNETKAYDSLPESIDVEKVDDLTKEMI